MENFANEKEILNAALGAINEACDLYLQKKIDDSALRQTLENIPDALWQDGGSSANMIEVLAKSEGLYDVSEEREEIFSGFVCDLLPKAFWNNADGILETTKIIIKTISSGFGLEIGVCDFEAIFKHIPQELWENEWFALNMIEIIMQKEHCIVDLNHISELVPDAFWNDKENAKQAIGIMLSLDEWNDSLALFPDKVWEDRELIFEVVSNYENDRVELLFDFIPNSFKSDKELILDLLQSPLSSDVFEMLLDWIDPLLWSDEEIVILCLKIDFGAFEYISDELIHDKEFVMRCLEVYFVAYGCISFEYISEELMSDKEFIMRCLKTYPDESGYILECVSDELKSDEEFKRYVEDNFDTD